MILIVGATGNLVQHQPTLKAIAFTMGLNSSILAHS
jgi:hypothetical protein